MINKLLHNLPHRVIGAEKPGVGTVAACFFLGRMIRLAFCGEDRTFWVEFPEAKLIKVLEQESFEQVMAVIRG